MTQNRFVFAPTLEIPMAAEVAGTAGGAEAEPHKSEYELLREANMRRNAAVMRALGLDDSDFTLHRNFKGASAKKPAAKKKAAPKRKHGDADDDGDGGDGNDTEGAIRAPAARRSARQAGLAAQERALPAHELGDDEGSAVARGRDKAPLRASEEDHALAEAELSRWSGRQRRASVVGTASYAHTLMRVRTMNEAALARRATAIERACGRHAVVKMRLFARVLCLEGYDELAEEATAALARLIEKLGDVSEDEDEEAEEEGGASSAAPTAAGGHEEEKKEIATATAAE